MNCLFHKAVDQVSRLRPGECITFDRQLLDEIGSSQLAGVFRPSWSPVDRIMENVIGSSYEIITREHPYSGDITFHKLEKPLEGDNRRTYVSPDHLERGYFQKNGDFFVRVKS